MRLVTAISVLSLSTTFPNKALGRGNDDFVKALEVNDGQPTKQMVTNTNLMRTIRNRKGKMNINMKHAFQTPTTSSNPDVGILAYGYAEYTNNRNLQDNITSPFDFAQQMFCEDNTNCSCTDIDETASTMLVECKIFTDYCYEGLSVCGVNVNGCIGSSNYVFNITGEAEFEVRHCEERPIPSSEKVCYFASFVNTTVHKDLSRIQADGLNCAVYFNDVKCQNCEVFSREGEYCDQSGTCAKYTYSCYYFDCTNTEGGMYSCYENDKLNNTTHSFLI
jgi:hypothetical protein